MKHITRIALALFVVGITIGPASAYTWKRIPICLDGPIGIGVPSICPNPNA